MEACAMVFNSQKENLKKVKKQKKQQLKQQKQQFLKEISYCGGKHIKKEQQEKK